MPGDRTIRAAFTAVRLAAALMACTAAAWAQPAIPGVPPGVQPESLPAPMGAAEPESVKGEEQKVADVRVEGRSRVQMAKIQPYIRVRPGRAFNFEMVEADVRSLLATRLFVEVKPLYQNTPDGVVIIYKVVERPMINEVLFVGNQNVRAKTLKKESGLQIGDAIDPSAVAEARTRIEEYYHRKGFNFAQVSVLEGSESGDARAVFQIHEGPKQQIDSVDFIGNTIVSDERLRTLLKSKPVYLWRVGASYWPWRFGGLFAPEKVDEDLDRLSSYYHGLGFWSVRIGREIEYDDAGDSINVTFVIDEGPQFKVRDITLIGNEKHPTEELTGLMKLKVNDYFNQDKLQLDVNTIKNLYGGEGHIHADVQPDVRFLEEPGLLDIVYQIDEGARFRVGKINVVINGDYPHTKITTVLNRVSLHPGDVLDINELRASERRLKGSGLFLNDPAKGAAPKIVFGPPKMNGPNGGRTQMASGKGGARGQDPGSNDGWFYDERGGVWTTPSARQPAPGERLIDVTMLEDGRILPPVLRDVPAAELEFDAPPVEIAPPSVQNRPAPSAFPAQPGQRQPWPQSPPPVPMNPAPAPGQHQSGYHQPPSPAPAKQLVKRLPSLPRRTPAAKLMEDDSLLLGDAGESIEIRSRPLDDFALTSAQFGDHDSVKVAAPRDFTFREANDPANLLHRNRALESAIASRQPVAQRTVRGQDGGTAIPNAPWNNNEWHAAPATPANAQVYGQPKYDPYDRRVQPITLYQPQIRLGQSPDAYPPSSTGSLPAPQGQGYDPYAGQAAPPPTIPYDPSAPITGGDPDGDGPLMAPYGEDSWVLDPTQDIDVIVEETETGKIMFGLGVNSDAGLMGNIVLDEQNFDWRRLPRSFSDLADGAFRGGGQRLRIEAAPGTQVSRYLASWQNPYVLDTRNSLSLSGSYYQRFYTDYAEDRLSGRVGVGRAITPDLSATFAFRAEDVNIHNPRVTGVPALDEAVGHNSLFGFRGSLIHDTRDSPFLATEGHYIDLHAEQVIGDFVYPRAGVEFRQYWLVGQRADGSGRHTVSFISQLEVTGNDTPIYENFFGGGYASIRGFSFRGASPVENTVQVGGEFMWINSLEYMFPITANDMLRGVLFVDTGTVEEQVELKDYRVAPGFGLRVNLAALGPAPVALDFAIPVSRKGTDDLQYFQFFMSATR